MLVVAGNRRFGFEVKRAEAPRPTSSMRSAFETLGLDRLDVVHAGTESYAMAPGIKGAARRPPRNGAAAAPGVSSTSPFSGESGGISSLVDVVGETVCSGTGSFPTVGTQSSPRVAARSPRETVESVVERTNTPRPGAVMVSTSSP